MFVYNGDFRIRFAGEHNQFGQRPSIGATMTRLKTAKDEKINSRSIVNSNEGLARGSGSARLESGTG